MKKNLFLFLMAIAIIGAGASTLVFLKSHQKLGAPGVKVAAIPLFDSEGKQCASQSVALPENVLDFHSKPLPISIGEVTLLPKDTTFGRRLYESDDGSRVMTSVILMGSDRTSIHKPEFCIPGQGWAIVGQEVVNIKVVRPVPYNLPVMKWTIEQKFKNPMGQTGIVRGVYAFWFVSKDQVTPHHGGRVFSMIKNLFRTGELERWAYVACFSTCPEGQENATFNRLQTFIAASVPEFQLTSGIEGALARNVPSPR